MPTSQSPIVVIGAGLAGWAVIDALRAKTDTPITLLTADNADRYHKPMLSSGFAQAKSPQELVRATGVDACQSANISLLTHSIALAIDGEKKTVTYQKDNQNHTLTYSHLVLATGACPTYPQGVDKDLATDFNHLDGYHQIHTLINNKKSQALLCHIAIIGAGMVGVEIAEDLARAGVKVSLLDSHAYPLSSLLPKMAGERFIDALTTLGIDYHSHTRVLSTAQDGDKITLTLTHQETEHALSVDGLIVATGLGFDDRLAKSAGIAHTAQGIDTDEHLQTSVKDIYAIGDCVAIDGVPCRFVAPHRSQASTIANAITGTPTAYAHTTPMVRLKNKSLSIQATGTPFAKADWQLVDDVDGKLTFKKFQDGQEIATLTVQTKA